MRLIYIFLNQGTVFPVGGGSREESNTVDIGGEEALAASSISEPRLRLMAWGCSGIADLGFFWMGLFTGVKEVTGGGNTPNPSVFTMVPLPIGGAPLAFFGGATEATEGTEADVLAGVATGLGPPAPWFKKNNAYGIMGSLSWCFFFRTILYKCISVPTSSWYDFPASPAHHLQKTIPLMMLIWTDPHIFIVSERENVLIGIIYHNLVGKNKDVHSYAVCS